MPSPARPQPAAARAKADRRKRAQEERQRRTAATKAARAAAREKTGRLAKAARAAQRVQTGRLRDLVLKPYTLRVYKAAVAEFFRWCRRMGHRTPSSVLSFDVLLCEWAEALFEDGDMKCILNRGLCGLAHLVPSLRGRLAGAWRLYNAWSRTEHRRQAPPIELLLAQALAAVFLEEGFPGAALCILAAHECICATQNSSSCARATSSRRRVASYCRCVTPKWGNAWVSPSKCSAAAAGWRHGCAAEPRSYSRARRCSTARLCSSGKSGAAPEAA